MKISLLFHLLLLSLSACILLSRTPAAGAADLQPGAVYVFFDEPNFSRPAQMGVEQQIDFQTQEHRHFSKLWLGQIQFPAGGDVTLLADADRGLRLFLGGKLVIDGWAADGTRQGRLSVNAKEAIPLRLEFFQDGGDARMRLFWQWAGRAQELVPASALAHGAADVQWAQDIVQGKKAVVPSALGNVITVPSGDEAFKSRIYRPGREAEARGGLPIRLGPGPHLFLDDYLIEKSSNLKRRVNCPCRDPQLPNPIITGKADGNFQPYVSVLRDETTGRFRIWYVARKTDPDPGASHMGYLESADGIHWIRPPRILKDPGPMALVHTVLDEGLGFADPAARFKLAWWMGDGLKFAASPDGWTWKPVAPAVVLRPNHDITNIFFDPLRQRYVATISAYTTGPTWKGLRRSTLHSVSEDLSHWEKPWYVLTADDSSDPGQTQFYAMFGYLLRGDLLVGLVKVLHDDWVAKGSVPGSYGVGYTALAWTRDGEHWVRDQAPFFEPDPQEGAWDHAHAWLDYQVPVGDEVYIYYGGYKNGHKMNRFEERQIGLVRMQRDRYVSRDAGAERGTLLTPPLVLSGEKITVNANVRGELRLRLLDGTCQPIAGFDADEGQPLRGDSLVHAVQWKGSLGNLRGKPLRIEFSLRDAQLYGFDLE